MSTDKPQDMSENKPEPGWIGICKLCKEIVKIKVSEVDIDESEMIIGAICKDCATKLEGEKDASDILRSMQEGHEGGGGSQAEDDTPGNP